MVEERNETARMKGVRCAKGKTREVLREKKRISDTETSDRKKDREKRKEQKRALVVVGADKRIRSRERESKRK